MIQRDSNELDVRQGDRGQILVIFVGGLVLLLAIAALVIDVGFAWWARRSQQNAADPAAIAAGQYIPTSNTTSMRDVACFYARVNGFFASDATCADEIASPFTQLRVYFPPSASAGSFAGRPGFVEVAISRRHSTFFAGVVGLSTIGVTTSAVSAFTNGNSNSSSLIALDPGGCSGGGSGAGAGNVSGGASVSIRPLINPLTGLPYDGGYVHVNSTCGTPPSTYVNGLCGSGEGSGALKIDGSGSSLTAPRVYVTGTCVKANNNNFSAPLNEGATPIGDPLAELRPPTFPSADIPPGVCNGVTSDPTSTGCDIDVNTTVAPGVYYGGWNIRGTVTLTLQRGIYVIAGGGIKLASGASIESVTDSSGAPAPVFIFSTDNPAYRSSCPTGQNRCQAEIDFTARSNLRLRAIDYGPYRGILLWQDGNGSQPDASVSIGGQGNLDVGGTIYAPKALVTLTGGSGAGSGGTYVAAIQIISWRWNVTGGAVLDMPYDPNQLYQPEQKGLVR